MGHCYRLYTEASFKNMPLSAEPEILRCGLTSSLLQLRCIGQELENLDLMDRPEEDSSKCVDGVFILLLTSRKSKQRSRHCSSLTALTGRRSLLKLDEAWLPFRWNPSTPVPSLLQKITAALPKSFPLFLPSPRPLNSTLIIPNNEKR